MAEIGEEPSLGGEQRSPWTVALLSVLTLGIYGAYWLWVTSKEVDRFDESGSSAFGVARWAIPTAIVGLVGTVGTLTYIFGSGDLVTLGPLYILFGLGMLVGAIGTVVALWRVWRFVKRHERVLVGDPLNPGLLLGVLGVGYLLMVVFPPAVVYVVHRTQRGLNRIWRAAEEGYEPTPAQPAGGFPSPAESPGGRPRSEPGPRERG